MCCGTLKTCPYPTSQIKIISFAFLPKNCSMHLANVILVLNAKTIEHFPGNYYTKGDTDYGFNSNNNCWRKFTISAKMISIYHLEISTIERFLIIIGFKRRVVKNECKSLSELLCTLSWIITRFPVLAKSKQ